MVPDPADDMEIPPVIAMDSVASPATVRVIRHWRTVVMLVLMGSYPLALGLLGAHLRTGAPGESALPSTVAGLLAVSAENFGVFLVLFAIIAAVGRPTRAELFATGLPGPRAWTLGLGYSVALRAGIAVLVILAMTLAAAVLTAQGRTLDSLAAARPQVENLLDPAALRDPVYFGLSLTLVSFIVAGLREELWRAVVLTGLLRLMPAWQSTVRGRLAVVGVAAVIFGFGHLPQGWSGVVLTGTLGVGLGAILLFHRSLWIAALAHGFFDATSFALIRLVDQLGLLNQVLGK